MNTQQPAPRSSAALRSATGRDYPEWFQLLDEWGAPGRPYRAIADWLTSHDGMTDWWAQKLIVEYEQHRGLREPGARPGGTYAGGASKTIAVPVERLYQAFTDPALRARWLPGPELHQRTSRPGRSARFDCADGTRLNVDFAAKTDHKSQVAVEQEQLPNATAADAAKAAWRDRLTTLKTMLEHSR
ncbi:MAG: SRPBCC family protein [Micromonosporaceae bacterium]